MIGIELDRLARRVRDMNERIAAIEAWARGLPDHPMPSGPAEEQPAIVAQAKDGPAAQAGLPAAEVAVTTENLAKWAAGRFGWEHNTYMNSLLRECCEDDIRANLSRAQAEHAREREADRRRIEELEKRLKTERAMKEGCQSHLLDIAEALDKSGADHEEDEPTSQRAIRVLADLRRQLAEAQAKLAELARATRVYLSLCSCEMLQGPEADIEDALAQAESDGPAKPAPWQVTEQSTIADLRRQLGEAQAEVADLLPRLDAAALENTQLGRERDGARNELAEAKRERADYGDKMTARTGELENELAVMREDYERVLLDAQIRFVQAEQERSRWFGELVLVAQAVGFCHESDGRPDYPGPVDKIVAQVKEYERKAEQCDDLRAKVDELESGARVARLVEANRKLKAKVERRTVLVEQALEGRRSNWKLSHWFDWEHTALAELATDDQQPGTAAKEEIAALKR